MTHCQPAMCSPFGISDLQIMYGIDGERALTERTLDHLHGYEGARPVRIGNAAYSQRQHDVWGAVLDSVYLHTRSRDRLDERIWPMLVRQVEAALAHWREPDHGLWEVRGEPRHFLYSKLMCWVALDRLVGLHEKGLLPRISVDRYRQTRDVIAAAVRERGWNARLGSYVSTFDGDELDASLLQLSWYRFAPADGERMRGTFAAIREQLGAGDGLLYRYRPAPGGAEGVFLIASAWAVEHLVRAGEHAEARRWFDALVGHASGLDLFAEELDPASGAALGNFPQAFTHLGVVNAALSLRDPHVPRRHETGRRSASAEAA